jgi:vancomycin permeability regulator SanA
LLLTVFFVGCSSNKKQGIRRYHANNIKPFDVVIVPGIPFKNGGWDSVMKARVIWSWVLYKNGIVKNIIYSGSAVYSPYYEAKIMGLYGKKLGIPKENIFHDTLARHSTENVYYSYLLAKQLGFKSIALATDPFQSFTLRGYTRRRFGTPIYHIPFVTDSVAAYNYVKPRINPKSARVDSFTSIKSRQSFFRRMKGTFGKDIDWAQYEGGKVPAL